MKGRVLAVDHLGIAVKDPRARLEVWSKGLGLELDHVEPVPSEGVRTWFLPAGESSIELLEPMADDTTIGKYLDKRGEGIHHLCLRVDDLDAALTRLEGLGIEPIGERIRHGAGGAMVSFLHPKQTGGVLIELSQRPAAACPQPFAPGSLVVAYLTEPNQRCVGVLQELDSTGLKLDGLELDAWEDWVSQWSKGDSGPLSPSLQFYPARRIERIDADRDSADLPSFARRFEQRTGRSLGEAMPSFAG